MKVHLKTLGCRLNEAELETWAQAFQKSGHQITKQAEAAQLIETEYLRGPWVMGDSCLPFQSTRYQSTRLQHSGGLFLPVRLHPCSWT